jgi:hypothetical protein
MFFYKTVLNTKFRSSMIIKTFFYEDFEFITLINFERLRMFQKYPPIDWTFLIFSIFILQHVSTLNRWVYVLNWIKQYYYKTINLIYSKRYQVFNEKMNIYKCEEFKNMYDLLKIIQIIQRNSIHILLARQKLR